MLKLHCSRCGKSLDDVVVKVTTHYEILKNSDIGYLSEFTNANEETSEILCEECFNAYCDCIETLNNIPSKGIPITQIIDNIQYGEEY